MKKFLLLFLASGALLLAGTTAQAQYKNALGVRVGNAYGITYKTFIEQDKALDFILNFRDRNEVSSFRLTGLYEVHNPINDLAGLKWFYGGGATIGNYNYKHTDHNDFLFSVDGVLGLDYKFSDAPINLSLDWKPAIEFTPNTEFDPEGFGLSVRITF
ncbi:: hypothetical protein [Arcticibacter svalbardensis MN12-7]|uniref:Outer membrane protein beta-barrel domain-containing protein n=1 Tax=Arcticibacter svalbardensis MN12-7 TaxID=1150600 RepID=R9H1N4_9SPHI|nr:hypothetical protein [Arcticibacter svalbardensis]EOR95119.1 : hypothetical protein [Arcticibacter svalbardensis MN12-7]